MITYIVEHYWLQIIGLAVLCALYYVYKEKKRKKIQKRRQEEFEQKLERTRQILLSTYEQGHGAFKCPACGANVQVNLEDHYAACPFCKAPLPEVYDINRSARALAEEQLRHESEMEKIDAQRKASIINNIGDAVPLIFILALVGLFVWFMYFTLHR